MSDISPEALGALGQYSIQSGGANQFTLNNGSPTTAIGSDIYTQRRLISMYVTNTSTTNSYRFFVTKNRAFDQISSARYAFFACRLKPLETVRVVSRANPIVIRSFESVFFTIYTENGDSNSGNDLEYYYNVEQWR